jgi:acyl dehydratase
MNRQRERGIADAGPIELEMDDLPRRVGSVLGTSNWRSTTQDAIDEFAAVTGDHQWIHTDVARAATGPFRGTILHGYFTLALIPEFARQIFRVVGATSINYGLDRVRFPSPVPAGASLRDTITLAEVRDITGGRLLRLSHLIEHSADQRPACVAETLVLATAVGMDELGNAGDIASRADVGAGPPADRCEEHPD